ncbi:MAG TPA: EAL domain-containing protein [Candidatus Limnocylindrales bacterium]|nr:EAL domain-containing protein [Candidatus Limnocylindrales bacterium]
MRLDSGPRPDRAPAGDAARTADATQRQLRRHVGIFGLVVLPLGVVWATVGLALGDRTLSAVGVVAVAFATWLLLEHRTSARRPAASLATRVALATNLAIVVAVTAEPLIGVPMTMSALIPAVLALAYVERQVVGRLMLLGAATGTYAALAPSIFPWTSSFGAPLDLLIPTSTLVVAYAIFHVFLWTASSRLTETATELGTAMALSREVAHTLDPQLVGRIIARHIAAAAGASDCALSTWDRAGNRLVTYAYYPPDRQAALDPTYDLADFPTTQRVLMDGVPVRVEVDDPAADPTEVAYLRGIGQRSMVILPLVVRGESIGTIELTSARPAAFTDRAIELAQILAREAAVSLENARLYDEIHHQAFRDALTGLANRTLFHDRVSHVLDRIRGRSPRRAAVLFLDIDHFKLLNDRFGHSRGDEVLQAVGERVRAAIRPGDTAARLGGDEFAVLLEDVEGTATAITVADRLLAELTEPLALGESSPRVGASIGIALSGDDGDTADDLLRNADIAMYAAKAAGRGRVELFRPDLLAEAAARSELGARLRGATERGELRLVYQPIVELGGTGPAVVGLEALVRWQPPGGGVLMPTDFIGLAEETGEIVPLGRWVIEEACRAAKAWQVAHDLPHLRINVNLSGRQFADAELVYVVAAALHRSGLEASCLTLEITESTLMRRTEETLDRLVDLRSLGVRLSIDDFGTGYSSLGYLQAFEVDELKIDRSFVSDPVTIGDPRVLSRAIVELGRALGLEMVVEGIETEDQAAWFTSLGCQYAQGHLYAPPLEAELVEGYLAQTELAARSRRAGVRRLRVLETKRPDLEASSA